MMRTLLGTLFTIVPSTIVPLAMWSWCKLSNTNDQLSLNSFGGLFILITSVVSIVAEFGKVVAGKYRTQLAFNRELGSALLTVILFTGVYVSAGFTWDTFFTDCVVFTAVLCDAWLGPSATFAAVRRDVVVSPQQ